MATAVKKPADYEIVLTLSRAEAEVLRNVCSRVGGSRREGPMGKVNAICVALIDAGVKPIDLTTSERDAIFYQDET